MIGPYRTAALTTPAFRRTRLQRFARRIFVWLLKRTHKPFWFRAAMRRYAVPWRVRGVVLEPPILLRKGGRQSVLAVAILSNVLDNSMAATASTAAYAAKLQSEKPS